MIERNDARLQNDRYPATVVTMPDGSTVWRLPNGDTQQTVAFQRLTEGDLQRAGWVRLQDQDLTLLRLVTALEELVDRARREGARGPEVAQEAVAVIGDDRNTDALPDVFRRARRRT